MNGWIKIHRKLKETSFYDKPLTVRLFTHLLLSANHKDKKFLWNNKEITIKKGSLITGRKSLSKNTGISEQSIRTALNDLKSTSTITIKSTNKFSIISICKWEDYQLKLTSKVTSSLTINQPATNHKQECKNIRILPKGNRTSVPIAGDGLKKDKRNKLVQLVVDEFKKLYGFKPTDKYPRRPAWNILQKMKTFLKEIGRPQTEEKLEEAIKKYFIWVDREDWSEKVQTLDVLRRKLDIFFSKVKEGL